MFDYDVTINGEIATGTITKTYRIGGGLCSGGGTPAVIWSNRSTLTATRVR